MINVEKLLELMRLVGAIASAALAFLPYFWNNPRNSRKDQSLVAILCIVACLLGWPFNLTNCSLILPYALAAAVFIVMAVAGAAAEKRIRGRFGRRYSSLPDEETKMVLAGPDLSPAALDLRSKAPLLSEQQIFERLDSDPLRTWMPETRGPILNRYEAAEVCRVLGLLLAILAATASFAIHLEVGRVHRPISLTPAGETIVFEGAPSVKFRATLTSCSSEVRWKLSGPSAEAANNGWGEISDGFYSPPRHIDHPFPVTVIAESADDEAERAEGLIQLRPHPAGSTLSNATGHDANGEPTLIGVEILDKDNSWCYGKTALPDDGARLTTRMVQEHVFDRYNDIICIGAASHEHLTEMAEDDRAENRADVLAHWLRAAAGSRPVRVHALKIGRYVAQNPEPLRSMNGLGTENERLVVIVGVKQIRAPVDLLSALRDAFRQLQAQRPILGDYLDHYPEQRWRLWDVLPGTQPRKPASASCHE